jgi:predicted DNA-binding transcriptional regulator YafY
MLGVMADATTASRLLTLLSLLQGRRDWPGAELAERLGVSPRTVRRDVERLRDLGYPVESVSGPAGGYRLRAGAAMPPLLLDDDEAIAIAVGLRTAARSAAVAGIEETAVRALVKLEQVLPAHLRRRVQALQSSTVTLPAREGGPSVDPQCLTILAAACRDHERARFTYRGRDGQRTRRDVEPHALVALGRRWYLVAFDPARGAWRTFRVDRIERPAAGVRFRPRKIPGGDAARYVAENLASMTFRYEVRVVFHAPAGEVGRRNPWIADALRPFGKDRSEYRTSDDDLHWLCLRLVMAGVDFDLAEAPPEVVAHLAELGRRAGRAAAAAGRA